MEIRESLERKLNRAFIRIAYYLNNGDNEMYEFTKQNFRAKIELASDLDIITIDEWKFLNRACALI